MAEPVIVVRGLRKSYGDVDAVRGIDLTIERGEIFAFLGPNGAGKTTTVEILEGYRDRNEGDVTVLGVDPVRATSEWRAKVGVLLQECRVPALLTVREVMTMYAGYYPSPRSVEETIELVGLTESSDHRAGKLSGGQQRRLDVALALIGDPAVVFLDEPTTGFDPAARRGAWEMIAELRQLGKTVFLTTHYMEEAQYLADRLAIIRGGHIVVEGRPDELVPSKAMATIVRFRLRPGTALDGLPNALVSRLVNNDGRVEFTTDSPVSDLAALLGWSLDYGVDLADLEVQRPTLEDVYLNLMAAQSGEIT